MPPQESLRVPLSGSFLAVLRLACVASVVGSMEQSSTSSETKVEVVRRLKLFGSIMGLSLGCLLVGVAVASFKKTGKVVVGPLTIKRGSVLWRGQPCSTYSRVPGSTSRQDASILNEGAAEEAEVKSVDQKKTLEYEMAQVRKHGRFLRGRFFLVIFLFAAYVSVSVGLPLAFAEHASCKNGFWWETHMVFFAVFLCTKVCELLLYSMDPTLVGELDLLHFLFKFVSSFLGYADAYTDAVSAVIVHSCREPLAMELSWAMVATYAVGIILLQWVIIGVLAVRDPSHACLLKLIHMDVLASCITIPQEQRQVWNYIHIARTVGEDIPQAIIQTIFLVFVQENYIMIASVAFAVGSSCKAILDAISRDSQAEGATSKLRESLMVFGTVFKEMKRRVLEGSFEGATAEEASMLQAVWDIYAAPHGGEIDKFELLDLLNAIGQPPEDEEEDLVATFQEIDTDGDGLISWKEFLAEMEQRARDGI